MVDSIMARGLIVCCSRYLYPT